MSAAEPAIDLTPWIELSETLSPFENLALVGFLELKPGTPPNVITKTLITQVENIQAAQRWLSKNFRKALGLYCAEMEKQEVKIFSAFAKSVVPIFMSQLSIEAGIAIGFIGWGIGSELDNKCQKYATKVFTGKGRYYGHLSKGDVEGHFNVTHTPMVSYEVRDEEAYPLEVYKIEIKEAEKNVGLVKVETPDDVSDIFRSFENKTAHSFQFIDAKTNKEISGQIDTVVPAILQGPTILEFSTNELKY